jgi:hypothetical protein
MNNQKKYSSQTLEKLLFQRQFFLGRKFINVFPSCNKVKVTESLFLTAHSELEITQTVKEDKSITLLGYILDPNNPKFKNSDIIENLIHKLDDSDDFLESIDEFGGRWILIVNDGEQLRLFHDAAGLRQVFYTDPSRFSDICCASRPSLIAEVLKLEMAKDALEFMNSCEFRNNRQHWWPGDSSPYNEIRLLLPNHYLDLQTGQPQRYWPNKNLEKMPLREAVAESSRIIRGLMQSARHRFKLAIAMTAGWDSRVLLAASKDMRGDIYYFTSVYWNTNIRSDDVTIPFRLLQKLGLKNNTIEYPERLNNKFKTIYNRNVIVAHDVYGFITQGLYENYPQDRVCVKGDVAEISKCHYRNPESRKKEITPRRLSKLTEMGTNPFAMKYFEQWLAGTNNSYNINLLDLFCWEQTMGSWVAMIQSECDIVQESFSPFNCRSLITTMLSVEEKYLRPPIRKLYKSLISNLWKEVLSEKINPQRVSKKDYLKEGLIRTHLYPFMPRGVKTLGKKIIGSHK